MKNRHYILKSIVIISVISLLRISYGYWTEQLELNGAVALSLKVSVVDLVKTTTVIRDAKAVDDKKESKKESKKEDNKDSKDNKNNKENKENKDNNTIEDDEIIDIEETVDEIDLGGTIVSDDGKDGKESIFENNLEAESNKEESESIDKVEINTDKDYEEIISSDKVETDTDKEEIISSDNVESDTDKNYE